MHKPKATTQADDPHWKALANNLTSAHLPRSNGLFITELTAGGTLEARKLIVSCLIDIVMASATAQEEGVTRQTVRDHLNGFCRSNNDPMIKRKLWAPHVAYTSGESLYSIIKLL